MANECHYANFPPAEESQGYNQLGVFLAAGMKEEPQRREAFSFDCNDNFFCRHIFLFDAAVIVCKRRGDNYEMKEVIDLHLFKITNNPTSDKENRKV